MAVLIIFPRYSPDSHQSHKDRGREKSPITMPALRSLSVQHLVVIKLMQLT